MSRYAIQTGTDWRGDGAEPMDLETFTIETRDSWGHPGIATYRRQSLWTEQGWAYVVASDTASGHGWGGHMHRDRWNKLRDRAQA